MNVIRHEIPGLLTLEPNLHGDHRGFFFEAFRANAYREAGISEDFVQDNVSFSTKGVLRGLHAQNPTPQGKLVTVLQGEIWDVAVDLRQGSPTFGQWYGQTLSVDNHRQFYLPPGIAHGFVVTGESALVTYKVTSYYDPAGDFSLLWSDPDIGVEWPEVGERHFSQKDLNAPRLREIPVERLFRYMA